MKLDESSRGLALQKILQQKLGSIFDRQTPDVTDTVGPFKPNVFERYAQRRLDLVNDLRQYLANLSDDEINHLVDPDASSDHAVKVGWDRYKREVVNRLEKNAPPWFSGGFGHPDYLADFSYWAQMPSYTNHEALCLTLGIEPNHFGEERVINMQSDLDRGKDLWPQLRYLLRRREQINRQFPAYGRGHKIHPKELFGWASQVHLNMHPDFHSHLVKLDAVQSGAPDLENDKALDPRVRSSMLKLIAVMSVCGYSHKPGQKYTSTVTDVLDDASRLGIEFTDDTVRRYLKLGEKMISKDWKP